MQPSGVESYIAKPEEVAQKRMGWKGWEGGMEWSGMDESVVEWNGK